MEELSIIEIGSILWRKKGLILIITMCFAVLALVFSVFVLDSKYEATVSLYVNNGVATGQSGTSLNDITASQELVETYIQILNSETAFSDVINTLDLDYSAAELSKMISMNAKNQTEVLEIHVTSLSPQEAILIANTFLDSAPEILIRVVKAASVETIDTATRATKVGPNVMRNTTIGVLLGFMVGVSIAILMFILDKRIKNEEDLKQHYQLPVLGAIPSFQGMQKKRGRSPKKNESLHLSQYGFFLLSNKKDIPFSVIEGFNALRTNLSYTLSTSKRKSFIITSTEAGEGKSTVAINSAIAFSEMKGKVLLIDADMRSPVIHSRLSLKQDKGLSGLLAGFYSINECIQPYNDFLDVISAGKIAPNPSELLASQSMKDLLLEMEKQYDYIIVDTPPCNVVTDAQVFAHETAGVVVAVRENYTIHPMLEKLLAQMKFANVKVLGIVLNEAGTNSKSYGRYGQYGRNNKYGKYGHYGSSDPQNLNSD